MFSFFTTTGYQVRLTRAAADITAAQRLRYEIFNVELGEGLASSRRNRLDADPFDAQCDHLIIEEERTGRIVGTYRLQTGAMAGSGIGYYSACEFDFTPYEPMRGSILELGRACIHKDHRRRAVLDLLWQGIVACAAERGSRYLLGCSSLTSQDPDQGWGLYQQLVARHLAPPDLRTIPLPGYELPDLVIAPPKVKAPKLFAAYLNVGAVIAGPPAIDRGFQTIDFLTILDLAKMSPTAKKHFNSGHD
jgi:putative hemolysin